jgi:hypothetical protein
MRLTRGPQVLDVLATDAGSVVVMVGTNVLVLQGVAAAVVRHVTPGGVVDEDVLANRLEKDFGVPAAGSTADVMGEVLAQLLTLGVLSEAPVGDSPGVTSG